MDRLGYSRSCGHGPFGSISLLTDRVLEMTDQELAHLRLAVRVELLKRLVASLYSAHCSRYPEQAPGLIHEMNRLREQFSQLALKATSPDSEVIASELREALDDVVGPIDNALGPFSFPAPQPP